VHDNDPGAHNGVVQRIDSLLADLEAAAAASTPAVVDLGAVAFAVGIPMVVDSATGVWKPITDAAIRPQGVLETMSATSVVGTCDAAGDGTFKITVSAGLTGADFIPGNGYKFPGVSSDVLVLERVDGDDLYMRTAVPLASATGLSVTEYPGSSTIVIHGALTVPLVRTRVVNAPMSSMTLTGNVLEGAPSMYIDTDGSEAIGAVKEDDVLTVSGHTATEGKNTTYTVHSINEGLNRIFIKGTAGVIIAAQNAQAVSATKSFVFAAYIQAYRVFPGMPLIVTGSGAGNNGTYTVATVNEWTKTITVAEPVPSDEAVVTAQVTSGTIPPVTTPFYTGAAGIIGNGFPCILAVASGVVKVAKGSVPHAAIGRTARVFSMSAIAANDGDYVISGFNTVPVDYDEITLTGAPGSLDRPAGQWGWMMIVDWGVDNVTAIDVDNGSGKGEITFDNSVTGGVSPGDVVYISAPAGNAGLYVVDSVVSPTVLRTTAIINGVDAATGSASVTSVVADGVFGVALPARSHNYAAAPLAAAVPFYTDYAAAMRYSQAVSRWRLGYQTEPYTFMVNIEPSVGATATNGAVAPNVDIARNTGDTLRVTLTAPFTINAPTGFNDGEAFTLIVQQNGVGGHTLTWNVAYKAGGTSAPSAGANTISVYRIIRTASDYVVTTVVTGA
jgi:hypothetical protein